MLPPEDLFGADENSIPLVTLQNLKINLSKMLCSPFVIKSTMDSYSSFSIWAWYLS
jgi:hypothetical protein